MKKEIKVGDLIVWKDPWLQKDRFLAFVTKVEPLAIYYLRVCKLDPTFDRDMMTRGHCSPNNMRKA